MFTFLFVIETLMSFLAVCHTIATTKLDWCEKKAEDATGDGEVDRIALTITRELQTGEQKEEDKVRVKTVYLCRIITFVVVRKVKIFLLHFYFFIFLQLDAISGRRNTIHNLSQYHK